MERTTTRLRKTFRFPTDNDSEDSSPEALDEEEQENLIRTLQENNTLLNTLYTRILLLLPLLSSIPYLPLLFTPTRTTCLLSILSLTSLLSTTFLLYVLPPHITALPFLDALHTPIPRSTSTFNPQHHGPIIQYLPSLNLGLCAVLMTFGFMGRGREELWWGFGWLPGVVCGVVITAKWVMGTVDPEGELGGLRYGFKGA